MQYDSPLIPATLIKRYKRFLADVRLLDGEETTVYCSNTGKMTGCATPGDRVWLQQHNDPKRKYQLSWELTQTRADHWICVNTARANQLAVEAIQQSLLPGLSAYEQISREVRYGRENSRIDLLLQGGQQPDCYIEVKSCTLLQAQQGLFPDTVTLRGQKHLRELIEVKQQGQRAILLFMMLHSGIRSVLPAREIDPEYARLFDQAVAAGVEVISCQCCISPEGISPLKS